MQPQSAESTTVAQITDTPREWIWTEYNRRKAILFREYGHGERYDRELRELMDELGV